ncbi:hypothetical protein GA0115260_103302 [Streptomyces sp. MnatMP-M27]|nr:hypothetical protein GA0115260_103302 [Streptomyces sp. MnatMP-M27]
MLNGAPVLGSTAIGADLTCRAGAGEEPMGRGSGGSRSTGGQPSTRIGGSVSPRARGSSTVRRATPGDSRRDGPAAR